MKATQQQNLVDALSVQLPQPEQWLGFMERLVPAVYPFDPELSRQFQQVRADIDYFIRDIDCIDFDAHLPKPVTARVALDYLYADPEDREINLAKILTRADQLLGRRKLLALAAAG
jgi:hypothetical protein